jgi:hypothetical protein
MCQKMRAEDQDGRDEFRGRVTKNDAMKEIGKEIRAENEEGKDGEIGIKEVKELRQKMRPCARASE